ncbi:GIY-YIG nuclease family protein [Nocardioides KLBMP 9356]|uniref:GIY-YIG nuclease family protein n=1 Tax=Nocardioides potassii TaxID=2911371 RepID=A0ABS9HEG1_9ACTN|nr:GIY-YIG nuclease family protein [Nocardioides potassii]MCF6378605.1 GIY-YIG nuclease family protein [Nocardioides potassii]
MPFVYMLRCSDGSYYVGSTRNLERRLFQHNHAVEDACVYTRSRRPVELVWHGEVENVALAFGSRSRSRAGDGGSGTP